MPLTNAQKQAAHRRRMAEKMARYEGALEKIIAQDDPELTLADLVQHDRQSGWCWASRLAADIARNALNPTDLLACNATPF